MKIARGELHVKDGGRARNCRTALSATKGRPRRRKAIIVAIDFSEASMAAMDHALAQARQLRWELVLVHVLERTYAEGFLERSERERFRNEARTAAQARLAQVADAARLTGVAVTWLVEDGIPAYEILKTAERYRAEMIVIGRDDRGLVSRMMFGSVTGTIIDVSPYPVLVITRPRRRRPLHRAEESALAETV